MFIFVSLCSVMITGLNFALIHHEYPQGGPVCDNILQNFFTDNWRLTPDPRNTKTWLRAACQSPGVVGGFCLSWWQKEVGELVHSQWGAMVNKLRGHNANTILPVPKISHMMVIRAYGKVCFNLSNFPGEFLWASWRNLWRELHSASRTGVTCWSQWDPKPNEFT